MSDPKKLYNPSDRERNCNAHAHKLIAAPPAYRDEFQQDVANLKHCPHFRRLQRKTQLFPENESDLFRDRLTHSIEVAQVGCDIARKLNKSDFFDDVNVGPINLDLVEFAGLAHDIGHPPFGHTGEKALDEKMIKFGGFEGNAQALRVLCKLARREYPEGAKDIGDLVSATGSDKRVGLNLAYRTAASILKKDSCIPNRRDAGSALSKGYYVEEADLVERIKKSVLGDYVIPDGGEFRTIECSIMDIADDIAYSTYDIEDAFAAGILRLDNFLYPKDAIIAAVQEDLKRRTNDGTGHKKGDSISPRKIREVLGGFAAEIGRFVHEDPSAKADPGFSSKASEKLHDDAHLRTLAISWWINHLIEGVKCHELEDCPALSSVFLDDDQTTCVEVLKSFVFQTVTISAPLQTINFKGDRVVKTLFDAISDQFDNYLMPLYERQQARNLDEDDRKRHICDYVAGMTDNFASHLYTQLYSADMATVVNHQLCY